ncbi:putative metallo-hydrolase YybB [Spirochaetia bacterium]|nr:putative metallo-hydrolase YybB [Spirochaetia bacterium]
MRLLQNLYVLTGPVFGILSHVYAIKYSGGIVMVDGGIKNGSEESIAKWLGYWGLEKEKVTHMLITHGHWDHTGLAADYREKGARIVAHRKELPWIEAGGPPPDDPEQILWPSCKVDTILEGDCKFSIAELEVKVIHVPGHTPGSVIYRINLDGKDVWFVGDFFPPEGHPAHGVKHGWTGDQFFSSRDLIESFKKVQRYHPDMILAGHGYLRVDGCADILKNNYNNILLAFPSR